MPRDPAWSFTLVTLALACYQLGESETAARLYPLLEPYADRNIVTGRVGAICLGPAAYFLGLLDLTRSLPDQALRRFQQAATLADRMQARPMVAMSREGQARALLTLDRPGDRQQATALLDQVAATAQELGIYGLGERAGTLRAAAQAAGYGLDTEAIPDEQIGMAEQELLLAERHAALREALTGLTPRCQRLIALLIEDPPLPYAQISARLGIPVGSIGPCRSRCLDKLRRNPAIAALIDTDGEPATGELPGQARQPAPPRPRNQQGHVNTGAGQVSGHDAGQRAGRRA